MTTTDGPTGGGRATDAPPPPPPFGPPPFAPQPPGTARPVAPERLLRRSRSDRFAAGVAGGLGRYFGVDPVLFRVLFATAAFFGGAGILAYLLAWAAIPDEGTGQASVDRWVRGLRERRVPVWAVVIAVALVLWFTAFSWWAPGPFFPVMIVVIVLVAMFGRRDRRADQPPPDLGGYAGAPPSYPPPYPSAPTYGTPTYGTPTDGTPTYEAPTVGTPTVVTPAEEIPAESEETTPLPELGSANAPTGFESPMAASAWAPTAPPLAQQPPQWVRDSRSWVSESRAASRERRRRAMPLRLGTLVAVIITLTVLGIADAVSGIRIPVYFWATFAITGVGLLAGLVLRRTPWSMTLLLVPSVLGLIAFGPTQASLHDGTGDREWTPTTSLDSSYDLAFGQGTLDLRQLTAAGGSTKIDMAAGRIDIIVPSSMAVTVEANVHWGRIVVDGGDVFVPDSNGGYNVHRTIPAPTGSSGQPYTIDAHLADGEINIQHV